MFYVVRMEFEPISQPVLTNRLTGAYRHVVQRGFGGIRSLLKFPELISSTQDIVVLSQNHTDYGKVITDTR